MFSMVLVGSGSVSFDTVPDSGSSHFLIRSGSREMIRMPRIRIRNTGSLHFRADFNSASFTFWIRIHYVFYNVDLDPKPCLLGFEQDMNSRPVPRCYLGQLD